MLFLTSLSMKWEESRLSYRQIFIGLFLMGRFMS